MGPSAHGWGGSFEFAREKLASMPAVTPQDDVELEDDVASSAAEALADLDDNDEDPEVHVAASVAEPVVMECEVEVVPPPDVECEVVHADGRSTT